MDPCNFSTDSESEGGPNQRRLGSLCLVSQQRVMVSHLLVFGGGGA